MIYDSHRHLTLFVIYTGFHLHSNDLIIIRIGANEG